jgi:glycosyltransferase involved in cell wall biosynthesis
VINWISYYKQQDGYGRYSSRMVAAFQALGVAIKPATIEHVLMPVWMQKQEGIDWKGLTVSFLPPYYIEAVPGRHWLYSMTEGSRIPDDWVKMIAKSGVERVLVPSQHSKIAFEESGVTVPVSVVPGGTDPDEFLPVQRSEQDRPYTFLTFADRGYRKGWEEVWKAFYIAFGGKTTGVKDVRLVIKCLPRDAKDTISFMRAAEGRDTRVEYLVDLVPDMRQLYLGVDCVVLPSRSEGWGMPHREAAMCGLPVITQRYSGLDDGFCHRWSLPVFDGVVKPIPKKAAVMLGNWRIANVEELAHRMYECYDRQSFVKAKGTVAGMWLRNHQTWQHSAAALVQLAEETYGKTF